MDRPKEEIPTNANAKYCEFPAVTRLLLNNGPPVGVKVVGCNNNFMNKMKIIMKSNLENPSQITQQNLRYSCRYYHTHCQRKVAYCL